MHVRIAIAGFLTLLLGGSARAAAPSAQISAVTGEAKVGREGAWRVAKKGGTLAVDEFALVAAGGSITLALPGGEIAKLEGKALVPGRRLLAGSALGKAALLARSVEAAARGVAVAEDTTTLASRGADETGGDGTMTRRRRAVTFLGSDDDARPRTSPADRAEWELRRGEDRLAVGEAWLLVEDPNPPPLERRRAHVVLATVELREGRFSTALGDLAAAIAHVDPDDTTSRAVQAAALSQRGQTHLQLGNDDLAIGDFMQALDAAPGSAPAAQAEFFLGVLALSEGEVDVAKSRFSRLDAFPELRAAAQELLAGL